MSSMKIAFDFQDHFLSQLNEARFVQWISSIKQRRFLQLCCNLGSSNVRWTEPNVGNIDFSTYGHNEGTVSSNIPFRSLLLNLCTLKLEKHWFRLGVLVKLQEHVNPPRTLALFASMPCLLSTLQVSQYMFVKLVHGFYSINDEE